MPSAQSSTTPNQQNIPREVSTKQEPEDLDHPIPYNTASSVSVDYRTPKRLVDNTIITRSQWISEMESIRADFENRLQLQEDQIQLQEARLMNYHEIKMHEQVFQLRMSIETNFDQKVDDLTVQNR